jgi:hypothetical protein
MMQTPTTVPKVLKGLGDEGFIDTEDELREYVGGQRRAYENPDRYIAALAVLYPTFISWMAYKMQCTVREATTVIRWSDAAGKPTLPNNEPVNRTNVVSLTLPLRARSGLNRPASTAINIKGL